MQQLVSQRQDIIYKWYKAFADSYVIPGATKHDTGKKVMGFGSLRGRTDLLNYILGTRGLYIFGASGLASSGHAIAFDTTNPSLYFLDPNFEQAWFDNGGNNHDVFFSQWFHSYSEDDMWAGTPASYKKMFHHGDKHLALYTLGNAAQLMV